MINAGVLFTLVVAACSPVKDSCENGIQSIQPSEDICNQIISDERLFNAECKPVDGVARDSNYHP